jgi:hypothetical protein
MKKIILPIIVTVALAITTISARADDTNAAPATDAPATNAAAMDLPKPAAAPDGWLFGVSVPLWAPKIDGNGTVRGHRKDISISFDQLREHLDASFSMAADARKGKFDFYGDVGYMKFSYWQHFPDGHVKGSAELKFLVADAGVGYTLVKTESAHPFMLEATAGARYWYAEVPLRFKDESGTVLFSGSKTWDLVDPVLGLRASQYLTRKLHLDLAGDGGGFNLNNDTDWTWSATGLLTYDFTKWFSLSAGYKALALDESKGSGVGKGGKNGADFIFSGGLVALNFHF